MFSSIFRGQILIDCHSLLCPVKTVINLVSYIFFFFGGGARWYIDPSFRGVRVDVCIHRPPNISACNQHNFKIFISKCSLLQNDYNEEGFQSRNSQLYNLFFISHMLMIEIVFKISHILKSCYFAYQYTLNWTKIIGLTI